LSYKGENLQQSELQGEMILAVQLEFICVLRSTPYFKGALAVKVEWLSQ